LESHPFNVRPAIICYQYSERIKSELIIASKLLGGFRELKGDELYGAEKIMSLFLDALLGEIEIAHSVTKLQNFREASLKIAEAIGRISLQEYSKVNKNLSEALSHITNCGEKAIRLLKEKGFL